MLCFVLPRSGRKSLMNTLVASILLFRKLWFQTIPQSISGSPFLEICDHRSLKRTTALRSYFPSLITTNESRCFMAKPLSTSRFSIWRFLCFHTFRKSLESEEQPNRWCDDWLGTSKMDENDVWKLPFKESNCECINDVRFNDLSVIFTRRLELIVWSDCARQRTESVQCHELLTVWSLPVSYIMRKNLCSKKKSDETRLWSQNRDFLEAC